MGSYVLGVDAGKTGGLVALLPDLSVVSLLAMPSRDKQIDFEAIFNWVRQRDYALCLIERQYAPSLKRQNGMHTSLVNYGRLIQCIECATGFALPVMEVSPSRWQGKQLVGVESRELPTCDPDAQRDGSKDKVTKRQAYWMVTGRGIDIPFKSGHKKSTPHDGLADAAAIALYAVDHLLQNG